MLRPASLLLAAATIGGCALTGGTLGGRETCWPEEQPRMASLMKGTLTLGVEGPYLATPEGEELPLLLPRFDLAQAGPKTALTDPGGGGIVAIDGELVTLFGGIGADGAMFVCAVEERSS
jgi:hypothetical protein